MNRAILILFFAYYCDAQSLLNDSLLMKWDTRYAMKMCLYKQGYIRVSLGRNKFGHYYCHVTIKGKQFNFIIDTGASGTLISRKNFVTLGLKKIIKGSVTTLDLDMQKMETFMCSIDSLYIGELFIDSTTMIVDKKFDIMVENAYKQYIQNDQEVLTTRGIGMEDGIIGNDILSKYNAIIDLARNEMFLQVPLKTALTSK